MPNPVVHFEITGREASRLQGFYRELFGWSVNADNPNNYGQVDTGTDDREIGGGIGAAQEGGPGWVTIYVEVPDLEATLRQAERLGGRRLAGPMEVPGGPKLALFADPEGHPIGLVDGGEG
jgi:uncharacterized protein